jgi:hypothetical protein
VTVYPITYFAHKIGRAVVTLRLWERDGVIPPPRLHTQGRWRFYLYEEIDAAVRIAEEEGIRQGRDHSLTNFTERVTKEWNRIWDDLEKNSGREKTKS